MNKRPVPFSAACVLSFIGSGMAALVFLAVTLFYNFFSGKIIGITNELSMEGTSRLYFLLMSAVQSLSLAGVTALWKFRRNGFFLYVFAQAAIILLPVIFLGKNSLSVTNTIFTIVFISIYFFYYRWINERFLSRTV